MEQDLNKDSSADSSEPETDTGTDLFYKDGRPIPPTHPDHGPMHLLPRQEDGSFAAYYYCSRAELHDADIPAPPPRRHRRDGFTLERQERFLDHVRGGASGREAARLVGISPTTAYNLYNSADGAQFARAWDEAARVTDIVLEDTAFDRAVNGQEEAVYHKGEKVGSRVKYDNNLLMKLLRARLPLKYAPLSEIEGWLRHRGVAPPADLDGALDRLRSSEAEWGRRLPGESNLRIAAPAGEIGETPVIASEKRQSGAEPVMAPEAGLPSRCAPRNDGSKDAAPPEESGSSASPGNAQPEDAADPSTSSTLPVDGQPRDSGLESTSSTSSTSSGIGQEAAQPPPDPESPNVFRPPPLPRIRLL